MKRLLLLAAVLASACAAPRPCTRTLCVTKLDGTMEQNGWSGSLRATSDSPKPPVMNGSDVRMVYGTAEMLHGKTKVTASEGSSFKFWVSTRAVATIEVVSGPIAVAPEKGQPVSLEAGQLYTLPKAK